jgi:hypothetical protein
MIIERSLSQFEIMFLLRSLICILPVLCLRTLVIKDKESTSLDYSQFLKALEGSFSIDQQATMIGLLLLLVRKVQPGC